MKCAEPDELEQVSVERRNVIHLPLGILGFEGIKEYVLVEHPEDAPFLWLQRLDEPDLAFLVVAPSAVLSDYEPDIHADDVEFLGLSGPDSALIFNIVTLRPGGQATVNLKGPIVLNHRTRIGKQVIPVNAAGLALEYPLPVAR